MAIFEYIEDSILRKHANQGYCAGCDQERDEAYWLLREFEIDGEEVDVEYACIDCLRKYAVTCYDAKRRKNAIRAMVNTHFKKGTLSGAERESRIERIFDEFMRTPKLPNFIQNVDWPGCCGDFTVFIGDAGRSYLGPYDGFEWWGYEHDAALEYGIEGMMGGEDRVSLFRCPRCETGYWTFQCT